MPLSPIITGWLPSSTPGPHTNIGYAYIRAKPHVPYSVPSPRFKDSGKPVLALEEVGYALFYPCEPRGSSGVGWFPEPVQGMVHGYQKFLGKNGYGWLFKALKYVVGRLRFPAYYNAPVLPSTQPYPLLIFSHGLAGTRTTYTQYASALASQGNVVVMLEHRDGSAPAVTLHSEDGEERIMTYVKQDDFEWVDGEVGSLETFRTKQLDFRAREVYEAYASVSSIVNGDDRKEILTGMEGDVRRTWLMGIHGKVDLAKVDLTGHSFGGGTILHLLQTPKPDPELPDIPTRRAVALDPWLEPIPTPTASAPSVPKEKIPPVLVINSPGFTIWDTHFRRLLKLTKQLNGSFVTIIGSNHQSFSDFPLLAPSSPTPVLDLLKTINQLSASFLKGELLSEDSIRDKLPVEGNYIKGPDGKMEGKKGEVIVHLIGKQ